MPIRLFLHRDLLEATRSAPVIGKKRLINTIHRLHFMNGNILVHVGNPEHHEDLLVQGRLESCTAGEIRCLWAQGAPRFSENVQPLHVIVEDGLSLVLFPVRLTGRDETGFSAALPETGYLLGKRRARRHVCRDTEVTLTQSGFSARGDLVDFSPFAFRVRLKAEPGLSFIWMNPDDSITICLRKGERTLFSGPCRCLRQAGTLRERELVLAPLRGEIKRFRKQKIRTPRLRLTPPPSVHFVHPFLGKPVRRSVTDLTFSGFAVEEQADDTVLMPGLIIDNLEIRPAGADGITCTAQVIYRRKIAKGRVRCGFAILDMDFRAYRHLSHLMVHSGSSLARFTCEIETDALWEFFFDTGFIYPQKYHLIQSAREAFKDTYRRLYCENQDIEAHFTLQENDRVYGHVSIFRAYQRAWMVHHLAARPLHGKRTGLFVLKNILKFFDGLYRYPSIRIDHMMFYFRPENYFTNLFFGGFAKDLGNPRACSLDLFAYLCHTMDGPPASLPPGWHLGAFETRHLPELEQFYRNASGGLLLDVLRLGQTDPGCESLEEVYRRHGFLRQWHICELLHEQTLKALFVVDRSSPGFNLSELLNSIKVVVTDPAGLPWRVLSAALDGLMSVYETDSVPLMIYPDTYPSREGIPVEKRYLLWILDTQYGKEYVEYMENKTRLTLRFLLKHLLGKMVPK